MNEREPQEQNDGGREVNYDEEVASAKEAARHLQISESSVWRWVNQGILPAYRVGNKRIRFRRSDLEALVRPARGKKDDDMTIEERLNLTAMSTVGAAGVNVIDRARALKAGILARRGGERLTESWEDINEAREARDL